MKIIKEQKGMALATVLIIASILTILGITIWHYSTRDVMGAERAEKKMQAYYLAKSGADAVAQYIITNPDNIDMARYVDSLIDAPESSPVKLDEDIPGSFKIKVTRDDDKDPIITSTGIVDNVKEIVRLTLNQKNSTPILDAALFSNENIELNGNATVIGNISTNAINPRSIELKGNAYIDGNLVIAPDGRDDVIHPRSKLRGNIEHLTSIRSYKLPKFPEFPSNLPYRESLEDAELITQSGKYTDIEVEKGLIISTNDQDINIVANSLILEGNISVEKKGRGRVYLYIKDRFKLKGNSKINVNGNAGDIIIYYKGDELKLSGNTKIVASVFAEKANIKCSGNGEITGHIITGGKEVNIVGNSTANVRAIYAPNAFVEINGGGITKGSIVADSFKATGNANISFDNSIMDTFPDIIEGEISYDKGLWQ